MRQQILRKVPLFTRLSDEEIGLIAKKLRWQRYPAGTVVFDVGDPSGAMYLVKSGTVDLLLDRSERVLLERLEAGCFFGDAALVHDRPRTVAACVGSDGAELWVLARDRFAALLAENPVLASRLAVSSSQVGVADTATLQLLRGVPFFADLGDAELAALAGKLRRETYAADDLVFAEGTPGKAMYLVAAGAVKVISDAAAETRILATLGKGNVFGELSLLTDKPHAVAVRAITDVVLWSLSRADFNLAAAQYPAIALNVVRVLGERLSDGSAITVTPVRTPAARPAVSSGFRLALAGLAMQARVGAADAAAWFQQRSRAAQVRIAVVTLLVAYLLGVSAPATVLSAVAPVGAQIADQVAFMLSDPTPTPVPTKTARPTATTVPTAQPVAVAQAVAPMPTPTVAPTATPAPPTTTPTPTRKPTPKNTATPRPPTATPRPAVDFVVAEKRTLTACENHLNTILFVEVVDMSGNPLDGVPVTFNTADDAHPVTSVSGAKGPGKCEFVLICSDIVNGCEGWKVYVGQPFTTEVADGIRNNFKKPDPNGSGGWVWVEEKCAETGDMGNVGKHWSWKVVFKKTHP